MSSFEKRNRQKENTSRVKFRKKFSKTEKFLYQQERKVSRNLMLKGNRDIRLSLIFVSGFGTKKRFSQWGNAVQIGDSTRCCNSLRILTIGHCIDACGGRCCGGGISQKTCQDNIVLVLSGNKATKHWVEAFFIHIKESFSLFIFPWGQVTNAYKELKWDSSQDCYLHLSAYCLQVVWHRIRSPYPEKS